MSTKLSMEEDEEFVDPVLPLCEDILNKLPEPFNIEEVAEQYPIVYEDSMNTVLRQELIRYDEILKIQP